MISCVADSINQSADLVDFRKKSRKYLFECDFTQKLNCGIIFFKRMIFYSTSHF